jgi:hypothetical protein
VIPLPNPKCFSCSTYVDRVSFHCQCGRLAEFHCRTCATFQIQAITTVPRCGLCQRPMDERGFRPGAPGSAQAMEEADPGFLERAGRNAIWQVEYMMRYPQYEYEQQEQLHRWDALIQALA